MDRRTLLFALALGFALPGAQANDAHHALTPGEVRRVDLDAKKLTLKHERIDNLDMGPMTMVFQVKDATMLEALKPGDRVRFRAENPGGVLTVTKIEKAAP